MEFLGTICGLGPVFYFYLQIAITLAIVHAHLSTTGARVFSWHGVLHLHPLLHADPGFYVNPHLQLENDKGDGLLHVYLLLPVRPDFARI